MATLMRLRLVENNDVKVTLTAQVGGQPLDLSTVTDIRVYLKTSVTQDDSDASVFSLTGGQVAIADAAAGISIATIPAGAVTVDKTDWHADIVDASGRHTFLRGPLTVDST